MCESRIKARDTVFNLNSLYFDAGKHGCDRRDQDVFRLCRQRAGAVCENSE